MTGRFVDNGLPFLAAVTLFLAVIASPASRDTFEPSVAASHVFQAGRNVVVGTEDGGLDASSSPHALIGVRSDRFDYRGEKAAELEGEVTLPPLPSFPSFDTPAAPHRRTLQEVACYAVAATTRPLRC